MRDQGRAPRRRSDVRTRRDLLLEERGTIRKAGTLRLDLVYPSPYGVAMSSLGYQTLYRVLNELPGVSCERAVLDTPHRRERLTTIESGRLVAEATVIGLSVATEEEVALAARALLAAGVPPLEVDRRGLRQRYPLVVAGGPLTLADGRPLEALADVVLHGEAEDSLSGVIERVGRAPPSYEALLESMTELPGAVVPALDETEELRFAATADSRWLPAFSAVTTPRAEFGDMFLIEAARGCPHRCAFCVMESRRFRPVPPDDVLRQVPADARRVGIVGAALCDHPHIREIVARLVASERHVSLSSLRADRLDEDLLALLVRGGARTLTIAADGTSERLRRMVRKQVSAEHLLRAVALGARTGLRAVKLYAMIGLPTETEDDVEELGELTLEMARELPISLAISPFVPKASTTLAGAPFAATALLRRHLSILRRKTRGVVDLRATSVRAAWIENAVARGGRRAGLAAAEVAARGVTFPAWRDAIERFGLAGATTERTS